MDNDFSVTTLKALLGCPAADLLLVDVRNHRKARLRGDPRCRADPASIASRELRRWRSCASSPAASGFT